MNKRKGFTLIELLVVIAIIGILSSVVLASLNSARSKGSDSAIKSQLAAIRPQAEIYYDTNGNYGTATVVTVQSADGTNGCSSVIPLSLFTDATINNQIKGVFNNSGYVSCQVITSGGNTAWAVAAILKSSNTTAWCVDSTGASKSKSGLTANTPSGAITSAACN